jgi:F0F1-type ATP synthase membrane subunit a
LLLFYPAEAPIFLLKFLISVEALSYFVRSLSLPGRLLANMISGHSLLKIFTGFLISPLSFTALLKIFVLLP